MGGACCASISLCSGELVIKYFGEAFSYSIPVGWTLFLFLSLHFQKCFCDACLVHKTLTVSLAIFLEKRPSYVISGKETLRHRKSCVFINQLPQGKQFTEQEKPEPDFTPSPTLHKVIILNSASYSLACRVQVTLHPCLGPPALNSLIPCNR